ncbi:MAG: LysM peptidoglycan-binding domain-containing protein [Chloroflexota bacterium]
MHHLHALQHTKSYAHLCLLWIALLLFTACSPGGNTTSTPSDAAPIDSENQTETEPPPPAIEEEPTELDRVSLSPFDRPPDILITQANITLVSLARELGVPLAQLQRTNPHLEEEVSIGTLVIIPIVHYASEGETLASIADEMGLNIIELSAINPDMITTQPLTAGDFVAVPVPLGVQKMMEED